MHILIEIYHKNHVYFYKETNIISIYINFIKNWLQSSIYLRSQFVYSVYFL